MVSDLATADQRLLLGYVLLVTGPGVPITSTRVTEATRLVSRHGERWQVQTFALTWLGCSRGKREEGREMQKLPRACLTAFNQLREKADGLSRGVCCGVAGVGSREGAGGVLTGLL